MATKEELEKKIDKFEVNMTRTDRIVNGTENEDVRVDDGQLVPSIRKWQKEMEGEYGVPAEAVTQAQAASTSAQESATLAGEYVQEASNIVNTVTPRVEALEQFEEDLSDPALGANLIAFPSPDGTPTTLADLANPDKGAAMVARGVVAVAGIKELSTVPRGLLRADQLFDVSGFYQGSIVGGGSFKWSAQTPKSEHTVVTVIDPDRLSAWDGTQNDLATLFAPGSGFGCFVRVGGDLSLEACGATGEGDDTLPIDYRFAHGGVVEGREGVVYNYTPKAKVVFAEALELRGVSVSFNSSFDGFVWEFKGATHFSSTDFDFNNNYYCNVTGRELAPILASGPLFTEYKSKYRNLLGIQDRLQYAIKILNGTYAYSVKATFENIVGVTNTAGTSGFCGGVFIGTDPDDLANTSRSTLVFDSMIGVNVKTIANSNNVRFPDSDLVRYYAYQLENPGAHPDADIEIGRTKVIVKNQYCKNVLKSGTKLSNCIAVVQDCEFYIDDLDGQDSVYAAHRYQAGPDYRVDGIVAKGPGIFAAVVASGDSNDVRNIHYSSDYVNGTPVFAGGNPAAVVKVRDIWSDQCAHAITVSSSKYIEVEGITLEGGGPSISLVKYVNPSKVVVRNISPCTVATPLLSNNNTLSTYGEFLFEDVHMTCSASAIILTHVGGGTIRIKDSEIDGTFWRVLAGSVGVKKFVLDNTRLETFSANETQLLFDFNNVPEWAFINGSEVVDNRGNKNTAIVRSTGNKRGTIKSFRYTGTERGTTNNIDWLSATGDGTGDLVISDSSIETLDIMSDLIVASGYRVARINDLGVRQFDDTGCQIDLTGNAASTVDGLYGNIRATDPVIGADDVKNVVKIS